MAIDIFITFLFVFLNGFFVAAEFAIVKVRSSQLEIKAQEGNSMATLARHITSHLDGYLAATQLGITLASLGLGAIGEPVVSKLIIRLMEMFGIVLEEKLAHDIALPFAFVTITILHIVFGELAPKSIAIQRSEKTTLFIAYPLQVFYIICKPFIWALNGIANILLRLLGIAAVHNTEVHSNDELKYLVLQGKESGNIEASNYDIIKNAFDFSERTVKQIMVPRNRISAIDINKFDQQTLDKLIEESYSRVPCYEEGLDNVIGIVHLKDILLKIAKGEKPELRSLMRPVTIVPESKRISSLLKDFQLKRQQMAIVVNEFGGTDGIITMEDILEELVGEIQDEYDSELPVVEKISEYIYTVIASSPLDDINELLPTPIPKDPEYETLAGYLILKFGKIPNNNEKIISDNYEFTILKKSKSAIVLVKLSELHD